MIQATRCIICQENDKSSKLLSYVLSDYLAKGTLSALKRSALCEILNFYLDHSRPKNNHHQENFWKYCRLLQSLNSFISRNFKDYFKLDRRKLASRIM